MVLRLFDGCVCMCVRSDDNGTTSIERERKEIVRGMIFCCLLLCVQLLFNCSCALSKLMITVCVFFKIIVCAVKSFKRQRKTIDPKNRKF